jgi:hypothetical protein
MSWRSRGISAKGLIIAPEIVSRFIFGGSGGRALVVARDPAAAGRPRSSWRRRRLPGRHLGVGRVTMVMTNKGFNSLLATSFKMGGDASVAAGPSAQAPERHRADLITFNRARACTADSTSTARWSPADDWNQAYLGRRCCRPTSSRMSVTNKMPTACWRK